jgi:hypothetical protein
MFHDNAAALFGLANTTPAAPTSTVAGEIVTGSPDDCLRKIR